tara:strand:- start:2604 stop:3161 length:558 start_codon:yes stop_codon:yes gene_type:complete
MDELSMPIKERVRRLAKMKLLYHYGGLVVPPSFLCLKNLQPLYMGSDMRNFRVQCDERESIIASKRNDDGVFRHMKNLEKYITDLSEEVEFKNLLNKSAEKNMAYLKDGHKKFGLIDKTNEPIKLSALLGDGVINFDETLYGIFLPCGDIIQSHKYSWFAYIGVDDIKRSSLYISNFFIEYDKMY